MSNKLALSDLLTAVKGIGPTSYLKLEKKNITTVSQLLNYFPIRYESYLPTNNLSSMEVNKKYCFEAEVEKFTSLFTKRGLQMQRITVFGEHGKTDLVYFNQPYLKTVFKAGSKFRFAVRVGFFAAKKVSYVEEYESTLKDPLHVRALIPFYSEATHLSSRFLREKLQFVLNLLTEADLPFPEQMNYLLDDKRSPLELYRCVHAPKTLTELVSVQKRVNLERLLSVLFFQQKMKAAANSSFSRSMKVTTNDKIDFLKTLPFTPTKAQERVFLELEQSLTHNRPMNRLLLGDVGSGKTVIIAFAAYLTHKNDFRTVILSPTETLCLQHYEVFRQLFAKQNLKLSLRTNGQKEGVEPENADILFATHSFLYMGKQSRVALVIIDEQHKFGVKQREKALLLSTEDKLVPHLLSVTATPIPRSLALLLYGHLDLSYLDEMPLGRLKIKTFLVANQKREKGYYWIKEQIITQKIQALFICPLISESSAESMSDVKSVQEELSKLRALYPDLVVEGLHSKLKNKLVVLEKFRRGLIHILVSTTVLEVGFDNPNANIMVIESSERYGLAQLHQLRGRIGRGHKQAYCFLFSSEDATPEAVNRLKLLENLSDGFKLAEADLKLRGAGQIVGLLQHGINEVDLSYLFDKEFLHEKSEKIQKVLANCPNFEYNSYFATEKFVAQDNNLLN